MTIAITQRSQKISKDILTLQVSSVEQVSPDIRHLEFESAAGNYAPLPSFRAGSHIVLECAQGSRNSYSLTGEELLPSRYGISVKLEPNGMGGSRWVHSLRVGDTVTASHPRSHFPPVTTARNHLLIAGGIGITAILSHLRSAVRWRKNAEVIYSHRIGCGAHIEEIRELCRRGEIRLIEVHNATETKVAIRESLESARIGTHVYTCGPVAMLAAVRSIAEELAWPESRVHFEAFAAPEVDAGDPFTVVTAGQRIDIASGVSMLPALESAGASIPNMCRKGVCGECRIRVVSGTPQHRDMVLRDAEKKSNEWIIPCVSRCEGTEIEVELP